MTKVVITAYKDRSFDFVTKLPPVSYYLKKAAKIKKGNSTPGRTLVGKVTIADIEKIAKDKMQDLNAVNLEGALNLSLRLGALWSLFIFYTGAGAGRVLSVVLDGNPDVIFIQIGRAHV